ncbi:MAG: branched-chain amino acid ABC transporter permease [Actinobacteria bacterium]|nr:branched-chain amino acid ABC transporter permease [Actinomycetota bacterium]MSY14659.1 branched-chain amino acid ABC transporter permease [Actinomycetota bacterium]
MTNRHRFIGFALIALVVYILSNIVDEWRSYQGATVAVYVVAIASVILLTGYSGQISLGHGALLAVGAYSAALTQIYLHAPVWICFVIAVLTTALFGAILGTAAARLSGPYLAGTTLALAVGLPSIANQFSIFGGEQGISFDAGWPPLSFGENFTQYKWFFWIGSLAALIAMWWVQNILRSRYGRSWRAVKSNEVAAELAGINIGRSKVLAFTISSGIAGLAGALLAMTMNNVSPSAFPLALSFSIATGAILSGVNTLGGVMIGSVALVAIPEIASSIADRWSGSENLATLLPEFIVSALLILTVFLAPKGPIEKLRSRHSK